MRYAAIRKFDITNGEGTGVSLFVQGCPFHCQQCFNPETWDFNGGKEWTAEVEDSFLKLIDRDYIKRVSFLGGSPLCDENIQTVNKLLRRIKSEFKEKKIWVYTGFKWEDIFANVALDNLNQTVAQFCRVDSLKYIDVLVDGQFIYAQRDLKLLFRGSTNQRIIDVQKSLKSRDVILWEGQK